MKKSEDIARALAEAEKAEREAETESKKAYWHYRAWNLNIMLEQAKEAEQ